jgi:hypothetical protein
MFLRMFIKSLKLELIDVSIGEGIIKDNSVFVFLFQLPYTKF